MAADLTPRLAERLATLRRERGWSLDVLAQSTGVSRATLSRLENAEVSPTAEVLGKLAAAYALPLSRLLAQIEEGFAPIVRRELQSVWRDEALGMTRRVVSPPSTALKGELVEVALEAGAVVAYEASPTPDLEHHLYLLEGTLAVVVEGAEHLLDRGDCLRYRLHGPTRFEARTACRYVLALI